MRLFPLCNGYMICLVACIGVLLARLVGFAAGAGVLDW
jgi:hypothetical protein